MGFGRLTPLVPVRDESSTTSELPGVRAVRAEPVLRAVFETATDAIVVVDHAQRIVLFNPAAEAMFGIESTAIQGRPLSELIPQRFREGHALNLARFGEQTQKARMMRAGRPVVALRANGEEFPVEASISAMMDNGQAFYTAILRDVTDKQRARLALERSNMDLQQFAFAASHDLRAPLRSATGLLGLLETRCAGTLDPLAKDLVARSIAALHRLDELTEDLLAYARLEADAALVSPVDCSAVLDECVGLLGPAIAESGATIDQGHLPVVRANRGQLLRLFQNLLENAMRYCKGRAPRIEVRATRGEGEWVFSVADNGIGIDERYQQRIFGFLQRLHTQDEYPGTGLGLAICQRIVERAGGKIWLQSTPGVGSTFFFSIPDRSEP